MKVAQRKLDTLKTQLQQEMAAAKARCDQAEADVAEAEASQSTLTVREKELEAAEAAVDQAKADLRQAQEQAEWNRRNRPLDEAVQKQALARSNANIDLAELMDKLIRQLPQAQQEVVRLTFYQGLSQREIAAEKALALGTVKARLYLAHKKLFRQLTDVQETL